jgi:Kef-type K+ transport system membrane component KefB
VRHSAEWAILYRVTPDELVARSLLAVSLVLVAGRCIRLLLHRARQPAVLAEIMAGVILGPTVVGAAPGADRLLFPGAVQGNLVGIGTLGLVLFMFTVGLELDIGEVRRHGRSLVGISVGAIAVPFGLGVLAASVIYTSHRTVDGRAVAELPFPLFVATALAVTAFPVLARIVRDRGLNMTPCARLSCASAAVQDVAGWVLLAATLAVVSSAGAAHLIRLAVESVLFSVAVTLVARVLIPRTRGLAVLLGCVAASAGAAQLIGLHAVLGAFLLGALLPRDRCGALTSAFARTITPAATALLLPIYFVGPGLHVNFRAMGGRDFSVLVLIMACACVGKLLGAAAPARMAGSSWREAGLIGVLLNTRGLVELVVLDVGRSAGILDARLFSVLVAMALLTTLMTSPLLEVLHAHQPGRLDRWPPSRSHPSIDIGSATAQ